MTLHAPAEADPVRVLYVGGIGRSGSTLAERLFGVLPDICPLGEVMHLLERGVVRDELCGCGRRFSECPFWTEVGESAFGGWSHVDVDVLRAIRQRLDRSRRIHQLTTGLLSAGDRRRLRKYARFYASVYRAAATVSGCRVVVDSSKHPSLAFCLQRGADIDLRAVHLVRDPRGVAHSWTKTVERPEASTTEGRFMARCRPALLSALWDAYNVAFHVLSVRGTPVLHLRFEDFLRDPRRSLERVARFAGVSLEEGDLEFVAGRTARLGAAHTVAGNPVRFASGPIELRHNEAWRAELPGSSRRLVTSLTLPLLAAYRYVPRSRAGL